LEKYRRFQGIGLLAVLQKHSAAVGWVQRGETHRSRNGSEKSRDYLPNAANRVASKRGSRPGVCFPPVTAPRTSEKATISRGAARRAA
jgi:hypothetical protein